MVPKLSAPLVKDIRTGEGVAEWLLGVGITALTACGDVTITKGVTTLTILAGLKGIRRGLLKIVALQKGIVSTQTIPTIHLPTVSRLVPSAPPVTDPATTDKVK